VGSRIDAAFDDTVNPFSWAFLVAAAVSGLLVLYARGGARSRSST
jgi:hypothetical protein